MPLEREIKLRFATVDEAKQSILSSPLEVTPLRERRLQDDSLLDTPENHLYHRGSALRVRSEPGRSLLTFKGPVLPGQVKIREEYETEVGDGATLLSILNNLGLRVWFRYQKYREEFAAGDLVVAIDETPIGVFVEIEGPEAHIERAAVSLGKTASDYITGSYRALYVEHCRERGIEPRDMLFR